MRKGRIGAISAITLLAALLAGCTAVKADQGTPAPVSQVTPAREPAAVPSAASTIQPAANENSGAPAGKESDATLAAETRTSQGGGVTFQVTPGGTTGNNLVLDVALNTHSVDLTYDYQALATLRDDQGHSYRAASWEGASGGHHLTGKLVFSNDPPLPAPGVKWIELELNGIAGVPVRTFRWDIR